MIHGHSQGCSYAGSSNYFAEMDYSNGETAFQISSILICYPYRLAWEKTNSIPDSKLVQKENIKGKK